MNQFTYTAKFEHSPEEIRNFLSFYFEEDELKNKIILDVGCRNGDISRQLLTYNPKSITGVDINPNLIDYTQKNNQDKRLIFRNADIRNLKDYQDSIFDIIICIGTIIYLPKSNMESAFNELVRVAKKNGIIFILFQRDKPLLLKLIVRLITSLPWPIYNYLVNMSISFISPISSMIFKRHLSRDNVSYLLWGLRGLTFGYPNFIPKKYLLKTLKCDICTPEMTDVYKVYLSQDKTL